MDLDDLIHRYRGPLVGLLAAWGNGPRDARELAQDTFAEAYLSRERFRGRWDRDADVGPWLTGIARNLHRSHGRRRLGPPRLARTSLEALPPEALQQPSAEPGLDPEPLLAALDELRGPWRTVLIMRYVDGSGLAEIGALLGLGTRAVEGRLRRAREELRRVLERRGQAPARPVSETRP